MINVEKGAGKMDKLLEELIQNYKSHLEAGERNLKELEHSGKKASCEFNKQFGFNGIWKIVIKDFQLIADKYQHELKNNKKKH